MLPLAYLVRNLTRNVPRTLLTCAAVALPIAIYVLSMSVVDGIDRFLENSARQLRLAVVHRASIVNPLPEGHRRKIESLDPTGKRLLSVCGMRWIGGRVGDDPRSLSCLAADVDTFPSSFPEYELAPEELAAWQRDRQAIIVGSATAAQFGWTVGSRITIQPSVPPYEPMDFHVVATSKDAPDSITNFFRRDYLAAELEKWGPSKDYVSFFFVKCASHADLEAFRTKIDELFANSLHPTTSRDEKSFMNDFITQQFNLRTNLTILALATVFIAVMAAANTMSMNFRDRLGELAALKSMGFRGGPVFAMLQSESLMLCAAGGVAGALIPFAAFTYTPLKDMTVPLINHLDIQLAQCAQGIGISLLIGFLSAVWPAWSATRLRVVEALRRLE